MKLIVLGSGTSHGIPVIGCTCAVCRSHDKRDKRLRSSLYVKGSAGERIVIDTTPEFRLQALRQHIKKLDALLLTHSHADHLHGLDDVRPLTRENALPIYANNETASDLHSRFSYIWQKTQQGGGKPKITTNVVSEKFFIGNIIITPLPIKHGDLDILGWLLEECCSNDIAHNGISHTAAYITDCSFIPDTTLQLLDSISLLIIDGLREKTHPTHFSFEQALCFAKKTADMQSAAGECKLKQVFLTHISHESKHSEINKYCKKWCTKNKIENIQIQATFDCMEINLGHL